jgi:hypothetical protein
VNQPEKLDETGGKNSLVEGYERPELTPIGNLHDLLARDTGSQCDESNNPATGSDMTAC